MLLLAALVTLAVWIGGVSASLLGFHWLDLFGWSELFLPTAALAVILGVTPHRGIREQFCSLYRLFGLVLLFWVVIWMAVNGKGSLLPLANGSVEAIYQVFGFVMAGLAIWYGIREGWSEVTNTGVAAFTILLYVKATDWWWDWMPHWLFFLVLGGIALGVMLLLKRLKARIGEAT
jgi:hypothetical protein